MALSTLCLIKCPGYCTCESYKIYRPIVDMVKNVHQDEKHQLIFEKVHYGNFFGNKQ